MLYNLFVQSVCMRKRIVSIILKICYSLNLLQDIYDRVLLQKLRARGRCNFIKKETLAQVFSGEFCQVFKNTYFKEHLRTAASDFAN